MEKILKKEKDFLKQLGFIKDGFDDKSSFWYTKKLDSPLFGYCEIHVQVFKGKIIITMDMFDKVNIDGGFITALSKKYNKKRLIKIIGILT